MFRFRALVALLLSLFSAALYAQGSGSISGRVTRSGGGSVGGVIVVLSPLEQATVTDANGVYRFDSVPAGTYTLVFSAGEQSESVSDVSVSGGATTKVDKEVAWTLSFAESITVFSASRKTERIVEAPAAVTVVSEQELARESATGQLPKVIESAPGVDYTQSGLYDINFNTRGFNSSLNRRILTLIDGRDPAIAFLGAQEWAALSFPLDEMASVELVRGPGSALYGANAFNGVLNMTTKQPRYSQGGKVQLSGGDPSTQRIDARYAGTFGNEMYYRVVGGYLKGDDWTRPRNVAPEYSIFCTQTGQINCLPRELSPLHLTEDKVVFGGLRFDKHFSTNTFTVEGGYATLEGPTFQTGIGRVQVTDVKRPWARVNFNMLHWNFLAYYDGRKAEDQIALSSGARLFEDSHNLHGEMQGNVDFAGGRGRLVGGLAYNEQDVDTANNAGIQTLMEFPHDEHSQAAFGQVEYNFTTSLKAVLAARWDDSTLHDAQFSPKASLVYGFTPNHTLRLNYNEAFQVPNYSEFFLFAPAGAPTRALAPLEAALRPFLGGVSLGFDLIPVLARGNNALEVEDITGYEVGYSGIFGGKLFMTLDYYNNKVENFVTDLLPGVNPQFPAYAPPTALPPQIQQLIQDQLRRNVPASLLAGMTTLNGRPAFVFSYRNAGKVDTQGVEVAFNYYLSENWIIDANYSWFDFEVKEVQLGDKLFPNAPETKFNAGVTFRQPKFDISAKYRWVDDFFWAAGVFAGQIPQYDLLNLTANYHVTEDIAIGANVSNVGDDEHYEAFGGDLIGRRALAYISLAW